MIYLANLPALLLSVGLFAVTAALYGITHVRGWRLLRNGAGVLALVSLVCNIIVFARAS